MRFPSCSNYCWMIGKQQKNKNKKSFKTVLTNLKKGYKMSLLVEEQILYRSIDGDFRPKYPKRAEFHIERRNDRMIVAIFNMCNGN